jgi:arsenate reductase (thioredoxin)
MSDVLFICVHNAGRSQMAQALFNQEAQEHGLALQAQSAGTEPAGGIHPHVVRVMGEIGLDLSLQRPRILTTEMANRARRLITMGCATDSCPALFLKDVEDWGLPDPKDRGLEEVRAIRDLVHQKVKGLVASLLDEQESGPPAGRQEANR